MRYLLSAVLIIALLGATVAAGPPENVTFLQPVERQGADQEVLNGRAEASTIVEVRARVTGTLEKVCFKEGEAVRKGEVLFQLDDRLPRAEVAKAEAEVVRAEAKLKIAETELRRVAKLLELKVISTEDADKIRGTVEVEQAGLLVARADLERAKINLAYTRITAPIDGKTGKLNQDVGNLIRAGADKLTTIVALDPLHVYFNVSERTLLDLRRAIKDKGKDKIPVSIGLASEKDFPHEASIDFVDNRVDAKTGTLRLRAVVANPSGAILPGQAVRVRLSFPAPRQ